MKKNYDRILLIVIGLITLISCVMLMMKSFAIGSKFPSVDEGSSSKLPETLKEKVESASSHSAKPAVWEPVADKNSPKVFRLMSSVPIVWKDEEIYEMYDAKKKVRPPMDNLYLMEHNLPYQRNDVLERDEDGDGFSNLEEFELGGTNPRDKNDYPEATHKLKLVDIIKEDYIVMFSSQAGGKEFSVKKLDPDRKKAWSNWTTLGATFPEKGDDANRFKALGFEEKDVHTPGTSSTRKSVGVLTVEDLASKAKLELVQRVKTDIPVYRASFIFDVPGGEGLEGKEFEQGDTFELPGTDVEITVLQVTENAAKLQSKKAGGNPKPLEKTK